MAEVLIHARLEVVHLVYEFLLQELRRILSLAKPLVWAWWLSLQRLDWVRHSAVTDYLLGVRKVRPRIGTVHRLAAALESHFRNANAWLKLRLRLRLVHAAELGIRRRFAFAGAAPRFWFFFLFFPAQKNFLVFYNLVLQLAYIVNFDANRNVGGGDLLSDCWFVWLLGLVVGLLLVQLSDVHFRLRILNTMHAANGSSRRQN